MPVLALTHAVTQSSPSTTHPSMQAVMVFESAP